MDIAPGGGTRASSSQANLVCAGCLADDGLRQAVTAASLANEFCHFCGATPAAYLDDLIEAFRRGLRNEYASPDDAGVPWSGRDGGYQVADVRDGWDIVDDHADVFANEDVMEAVRETMATEGECWVERDWATDAYEDRLTASWKDFCEQIQFKTRYVFWYPRDSDDQEKNWAEIPAGRILNLIGEQVLELGLVREVPAGSLLWRARIVQDNEVAAAAGWGSADLGTAPREFARTSNRMSPAGIPMFYGAFDQDTAVQEVTRGESQRLAIGAFELSHSCTVVDFTRLPSVPSMFDPERGHQRRVLRFLHEFVEQLAKPVRDGYDQIDYVPTQVVAEFLLKAFFPRNPVKGLIFTSSLTRQRCAVLNLDSRRCVEQAAGWNSERTRLGLVPGSVQMMNANS